DFLAGPEGQQFNRLGYDGVHYNIVDGKIELTDTFYSDWRGRFWEPTHFETSHPLATPPPSAPGLAAPDTANDAFVGNTNFLLPEEHVPLWEALDNLYVEFATDIVSGKRSVDEFDKFVDEWYKAGGETVTKYANEVLQ